LIGVVFFFVVAVVAIGVPSPERLEVAVHRPKYSKQYFAAYILTGCPVHVFKRLTEKTIVHSLYFLYSQGQDGARITTILEKKRTNSNRSVDPLLAGYA